MRFVVRLCVTNDAGSEVDRVIEVVPGGACFVLQPGEECVIIAVGLDEVPSFNVVESLYGTHVICEGDAALTIEAKQRRREP